MTATDQQVKIMRKELSKHGHQGVAATKAGLCRQTGAKYIHSDKLPSDSTSVRQWRTRADPFAEVWPEVEARLRECPGLWARSLFEELQERYPGRFQPGQLRTLYRRVRAWRALHGDDQDYEVFFPQQHRPGEAAQTDFTTTGELGMQLQGEAYAPLLCHFVLPYSNWEWARRCASESFLALKSGVQEAVFRLGKVPEWHQTDHSTGATHQVRKGQRAFNLDYVDLMTHLGMKPRTIAVGKKEQNGTVEAQNGAFKRFLNQQLERRGERNFVSEHALDKWLEGALHKANGHRQARLSEELAVMRPLSVARLPEFKELEVWVSRNSTINVLSNIYSVPPRLMRHKVRVRIYEDRLVVFYANVVVQEMARLRGRAHHDIDYRHVIWSLVQKPGAFARYRYRESLFPSLVFRRAYAALQQAYPGTVGDGAYLRLLHLAASTLESEVQAALELLLEQGRLPEPDRVQALVQPRSPEVPQLDTLQVDLADYDELLSKVGA